MVYTGFRAQEWGYGRVSLQGSVMRIALGVGCFKAAMLSRLYTVESGVILAGASAQLPGAIERRGKLGEAV